MRVAWRIAGIPLWKWVLASVVFGQACDLGWWLVRGGDCPWWLRGLLVIVALLVWADGLQVNLSEGEGGKPLER